MEGESVQNVWKIHFPDLNKKNENYFEVEPVIEGPIDRVTLDVARTANEGMKNRKASGFPGLIRAELHKISQGIIDSGECPAEWRLEALE